MMDKKQKDDAPTLDTDDDSLLDAIWDKYGKEKGITFPPKPVDEKEEDNKDKAK